jgi:hypothetical protein
MLAYPWYTDTLISESNLVNYFGPNHMLHVSLELLQHLEMNFPHILLELPSLPPGI